MMPRRHLLSIGFLLLTAVLSLAAEPKLKRTTAVPTGLPKAVADALDPAGYEVVAGDGTTLAQLWLRKELPLSEKKVVEGANYPQLRSTELVGLVVFPAATKDFRGQAVKPGTYTLRYELLPNDGNHMGVAPDRDFLLLVPVAADPGPEGQFRYEELVKLSSKTTGTNHPAIFSMVAAAASGLPAVFTDPNDYVIFGAVVKTASGALPISFVLKGVSMSL